MAEKDNVREVTENRREFSSPDGDKTYYIAAPTADDVRGADWQYSKTYTKSLTEGITTAAEMMDILMRRGIIGPEFEQRQKDLTDELAARVIKLSESTEIDEKQILAIDVAKGREELFQWNQRLNGPMANTCEQIADDSRLEYLTSSMVQYQDGSRVWDEYADFLKEKDQALALRSRFEVMLYLQGLDSDFLDRTPEAVAIKEIEEEIQAKANEALEALEKAKEEAEKKAEEKKVEEETPKEEKPKPKRTYKKRGPGRPKKSSEK
jgi:hypothetical protein